MAFGSNHLTTTTSAVFIPEIWSPEILRAAENAYVMAPLVKRFDGAVQSKGDTIHIPNLSNLTAADKSVQTSVTFSSPTETDTQILINKHKYVGVFLEDIAKIQSDYNLMSEYTEKAGSGLAKAVDTDLLTEYSNFSNTDVGTYGADITDPVILAASEAIDLANAPITDRYFVIYTTQKTALLKIEKFFKADYMGEYDKPSIIRKGPNSRYLWGELYGMPVYWTQQVVQTAGTPTQTHNIMFHKEAIALAMQLAPRVQTQYQIEYLGNALVADMIYGVKTIRADFGVEVRS